MNNAKMIKAQSRIVITLYSYAVQFEKKNICFER